MQRVTMFGESLSDIRSKYLIVLRLPSISNAATFDVDLCHEYYRPFDAIACTFECAEICRGQKRLLTDTVSVILKWNESDT